jgi:FkbM family methyltransferase
MSDKNWWDRPRVEDSHALNVQNCPSCASRRKNLIFVGANDMVEIKEYVQYYDRGIFIEPIPAIMKHLCLHLKAASELYNARYKAIQALVAATEGNVIDFFLADNNGASSSIYPPNKNEWKWDVKFAERQAQVNCTRMDTIINNELSWLKKSGRLKFDVVVDTQGSELEVLKSFGQFLENIEKLVVEVSTREFYKGQPLFVEINAFLEKNKFKLIKPPENDHSDAIYIREENV